MPRFYLHYEDKPAPPPVRWTVWRIVSWTMLLTSLAFWMGSSLNP